jgi:hypothetical protein
MDQFQTAHFQLAHPYFRKNATEHEKKFMTKEVHPSVLKYATMMHIVAPKVCEKCDTALKIPELCWREEHNISNFLCYTCIGKLEKENAELEHDGTGRLTLKK